MSNKAMRFGGFIAGMAAAAALIAAPGLAMAEHSGGGGGGGHVGGFGGGFGGGAHFSAAPRFGGAGRYSYSSRYSAAPRYSYTPRYSASRSYGGVSGGARIAASSAFRGRAFTGVPGRAWYGPRYGFHPYWGGGWWGGFYWPQAFYGWAFPWFLPVLPIGYATFWWGGIPYYYVNSVYYVYDTGDNGYVVTNPPPVAQGDTAGDSDPSQGAAGPSGSGPVGSAPDDVYMYPENGQSQEQQSTDRYQCHKWAQDQTGFDPTQPNGGQTSASSDDYRRAMIACLDARGYSTQ